MILPANLVSHRQEVMGDDLTCKFGQSQTRGEGWWSYLQTWSVTDKRWRVMILTANLVSHRQEVKGDDLTCILGQSQTRGDGWWSYLHTWSVINKRWWVLPAYLVSHRHEVMGHDLTCMLGQSGPCRRTSVTTAGWWTPVPVVYPGPGSHPAHSPRCTQHQYSVSN